jgi:hypothetical protein
MSPMQLGIVIALVACARPAPPAPPLSGVAPDGRAPARVTPNEVPELVRKYYASLGVIRATSDQPSAPDTPLLDRLRPCQIAPARALDHAAFSKFFPELRFFAGSCADGSYAVVSIDLQRQVRLVSLQPHERLPANAWDETTSGPATIATDDDAKLFVSGFGLLMFLDSVATADITLRHHDGTGSFAGTHYIDAQTPSFNVTLASQDKRSYTIGSHQRQR